MIQNKLFRDSLAAIPEEQKAEFELSFGIAERMDEILKEKNISQRELARRLGKRESEVSRWLTGRHNFTTSTIAKIETALGSPLVQIVLFDQISEDIKSAMKARDKVRLETLRNIKKVFLEAKTAPGANDTLADADALKIISKLAKQGKETAATYTQAGRQDLADAELAQVEVLESYLPKQLSQEEIEAEVKKIIAEVGATSMKDMGKVMGTASKQLAGKADGRVISEIVKKLLA